VSAGAHSLPVGLAVRRPAETTAAPEPVAALSRREATLRATATVCLVAIALVQAIELPSLFAQGGQFALLSMAAMAVCTALGVALTAAPAQAAGALWRLVAATAVVVLAGWALPRAFTVPGLEPDGYGGAAVVGALHRWASAAGVACAVPAVVCLAVAGMAGVAGRAALPAPRTLATVLAVLVVLGPGVWVALVALGPGAVGGEQSLAQGHVHSHAGHSGSVIPEAIEYRRGSGRAGGHYLVAVTPPARQAPLALGFIGIAALVFGAGAVDHLRRRSAPGGPVEHFGQEGGPA
jgi:hypothetical protein